jgi:hypothetical protein
MLGKFPALIFNCKGDKENKGKNILLSLYYKLKFNNVYLQIEIQ